MSVTSLPLFPLLTTAQPKSTPHSSIPNLTPRLHPLPPFSMGCFLSTQIPRAQQSSPHLKNNNKPNNQPISKSPPQPSTDIIESVKEVLSETPKPKPLAKLKPTKKPPSFDKPRWESFKPSSDDIVSDYGSSSFGDTSFEKRDTIAANAAAATTNTISPVKPNSGTPMRNPKEGSYSGELNRENAVTGRSPVRHLDPSPGRRNEGGTGNGNGLRRNARSGIDPGSGSGSTRRSRSPGTRTTEVGCGGGIGGDGGNLGRSQSGRKRGSPGRIRLVGGGDKSGKGGGGSGKWGGGMPNESLENPLVSLECFIFL